MTFIDDFSSYTFVYCMKSKSDVLAKFKEFVLLKENLTEKKLKHSAQIMGVSTHQLSFNRFVLSMVSKGN